MSSSKAHPRSMRLLCILLVLCCHALAACSKRCPPGYGLLSGTCRPVVRPDAGDDSRDELADGATGTQAESVRGSNREDAGAEGKESPEPGAQMAQAGGAGASSASSDGAAGAPSQPSDSASAGSMASSPTGPCAGRTEKAVCDGAVISYCDGSGNVSSVETCASEALCQLGSAAGACAQCAPGTFVCEGVQLKECGDSGQWADKEQCASEALCNASVGACTEKVCAANATTCDASGTLLTCNADGSAFASRETCGVGLCDAAAARCNRCMPGTKRCAGNTVTTCSADGQSETEEQCVARNECFTASCSAGSCQQSPKSTASRCEGSNYCDGDGNCVGCASDAHCSEMENDCNDATCQSGQCRGVPKTRGTACSAGLCDRGKCHEVECFSATDCSDSGARCTDGQCVACGDRKVGAAEECDIGAPAQAGDRLASSTYDEFSCDPRTCGRLYIFTPCTVESMGQEVSDECGRTGRCLGGRCHMSRGCNGEGSCTFPNDKPGSCYGNTCFMNCDVSADCPPGMTCQDSVEFGRRMCSR
jgi:hypothetical protein